MHPDFLKSEYYNDHCSKFSVALGMTMRIFDGDTARACMRISKDADRPRFSDHEIEMLQLLSPSISNFLAPCPSGPALEHHVKNSPKFCIAFRQDMTGCVYSPLAAHWLSLVGNETERRFLTRLKELIRTKCLSISVMGIRFSIRWRSLRDNSELSLLCEAPSFKEGLAEENHPSSGKRQENTPNKVINTGMVHLTCREKQIAGLIRDGYADKEIARELDISFWTVRSHIGRLLKKFGARSRVDVARLSPYS